MTSEIKENEIDISNEEVTYLEFIGDQNIRLRPQTICLW